MNCPIKNYANISHLRKDIIMDIATTLSSIKTAYELAQGLRSMKSLMDNADVKLQIVDLIDALVNAKADLAEIRTQVIDKDRLIAELQDRLNTKVSVYYEEPFYWKDLGDDKKDGPFCQRCYDTDSKLIRLIPRKSTNGSHICTGCSCWYGQGTPRQIRRVHSGGWSV